MRNRVSFNVCCKRLIKELSSLDSNQFHYHTKSIRNHNDTWRKITYFFVDFFWRIKLEFEKLDLFPSLLQHQLEEGRSKPFTNRRFYRKQLRGKPDIPSQSINYRRPWVEYWVYFKNEYQRKHKLRKVKQSVQNIRISSISVRLLH